MKIIRVEGVHSGGRPQRRRRLNTGRMSVPTQSSKPAAVPWNHLEPRPPRRRSRRRSAYGRPAAFRPPYIRLVELPEKRTVLSNRRLYRAAHQETITNQIHIVNYNTQGWDPVRRDNILKTAGIIDSARLGKWNLAFLTELHGHDTDQRPAPEIMRLEEYTIIRFGNTRLTAQGRLDGAEISWIFSEGQQASAEILRCLKGRPASAEISGDLISSVLDLYQLRTRIPRL
jgi:hypothetical protein